MRLFACLFYKIRFIEIWHGYARSIPLNLQQNLNKMKIDIFSSIEAFYSLLPLFCTAFIQRRPSIQGRLLFKGGFYSRATFIQGRLLFKGGFYLREPSFYFFCRFDAAQWYLKITRCHSLTNTLQLEGQKSIPHLFSVEKYMKCDMLCHHGKFLCYHKLHPFSYAGSRMSQ